MTLPELIELLEAVRDVKAVTFDYGLHKPIATVIGALGSVSEAISFFERVNCADRATIAKELNYGETVREEAK